MNILSSEAEHVIWSVQPAQIGTVHTFQLRSCERIEGKFAAYCSYVTILTDLKCPLNKQLPLKKVSTNSMVRGINFSKHFNRTSSAALE